MPSLDFIRTKYTYRFKQLKGMPGLIYWKPQTPGLRHKISIDYKALGVYNGPPVDFLSQHLCRTGGRDHTGRLRVRGRGGGEKRVMRFVDYDRKGLSGLTGVVQRIEHDPNRSSFLALTRYDPPGSPPIFRYHIAPHGIQPGSTLSSGPNAPIVSRSRPSSPPPPDLSCHRIILFVFPIVLQSPGSMVLLRNVPIGQPIHNLELFPGQGCKVVRAAHTSAVITAKQEDKAVVRMPSGELRLFLLNCRATIGVVSNHLQRMTNLGKVSWW